MDLIETTAVLFACALLTWAVAAGLFFRYWALSPAKRGFIGSCTVYHYLPSEYVQANGNHVSVRARTAHHSTINIIRGPVAFYYVGRNGRGGRLNHPRAVSRAYSRVDIPGAEFCAWLADRPAWYRRWDGALFVKQDYVGVGQVVDGVQPREDRSSID